MIIKESVGLHKERCRHWQRKTPTTLPLMTAYIKTYLPRFLFAKAFIKLN